MARHEVFETLWVTLHELRDAVRALELTVVEDRPAGSDVVPVDALATAVADLLGTVHEAVEAAAGVQQAAPGRLDNPNRVRDALLLCHERVNQADRQLIIEVGAFARRLDLHDLARARGRDWPAWTAEVDQALERCQPSLWKVQSALLACWHRLSDRPAAPTESTGRAGAPTA